MDKKTWNHYNIWQTEDYHWIINVRYECRNSFNSVQIIYIKNSLKLQLFTKITVSDLKSDNWKWMKFWYQITDVLLNNLNKIKEIFQNQKAQ